jgi:hypothetical protein
MSMNQPERQHGAQKRYQLSSFSRTEYGSYRPFYLTNWGALSIVDAGANGGDIHQGGFLGCLHDKYAYSPRRACVGSYRNSSVLMRTNSHGAWPGKRTPSKSRTATAPGDCGHTNADGALLWVSDYLGGENGNDQITPKLLPKTCKRRNEKRYQLSSFSRTEYGGYRSIYLENWVALSAVDAEADGDDIHHGRRLDCLHTKYASIPRGTCVGSYRNSSVLKRARCHGAWPGKRTPSQSRTATAPRACGHSQPLGFPAKRITIEASCMRVAGRKVLGGRMDVVSPSTSAKEM